MAGQQGWRVCRFPCLTVVMGVPPTHADPLGSADRCCGVLPSVFPKKCFQPPKRQVRPAVPCGTKRAYRHQSTVSWVRARLGCSGLAVGMLLGFIPARTAAHPHRPGSRRCRGPAAAAGVGSWEPRACAAVGRPPGKARPRSRRTRLDVSRLLRDAEEFVSALPLLLRSGLRVPRRP